MQELTIEDAESHLSEIINMATEGKYISIIRENGLLFKLVLLSKEKPSPRFGSARSIFEIIMYFK